jgi:dihydroxyacid dehydratase/phosphogluconate dehydratase
MEAKANLKSRLPGRDVTEGPARVRSSLPCCEAIADSVERKAPENAAAEVAASGGCTDAALHLPAIAHERGIALDRFNAAEVFKRTPYIADLKPAGRFVAKDLFKADGVSLLMKSLLDNGFMHGGCMTVTRYGMAENDANRGSLEVQLSDVEFEKRRAAWQPRGSAFWSGYLWKNAQQVGSARHGAITHPGGAAEKACYADI